MAIAGGSKLLRGGIAEQEVMTKRVLIIGGYGNFGSYIAAKLALEPDIQVIISGRSHDKAAAFAKSLKDVTHPVDYHALDITEGLPLEAVKPDMVIHTSGPFQQQGYAVARACIEYGCHYLDLADGRNFVAGIRALNDQARTRGVSVISGASSVPCLSSAVIDHYKSKFSRLESLDYGITTAQQTNRGLATTAAILGYVGKPFCTLIGGRMRNIYGWQDIHAHDYPEFGRRLLGNCDIPDLALLPDYYPDLKDIRFYAGTEIATLHFGLWLLSWIVRAGVVRSLKPAAKTFLKMARACDGLGSGNSAFHMTMGGQDHTGQPKTKTLYILAREGHGPYIPCAPAIILTKKLLRNEMHNPGAYPCIGLVDLDSYMAALAGLNIRKLEM